MTIRPVRDKLVVLDARVQACQEFLAWLQQKGIVLCTMSDDTDALELIEKSTNDLLAECFGLEWETIIKENKRALEKNGYKL